MMCGTVGFANASVKDLPMLTVDGKKYYHYEVTSKETLYTICKKLGVTKDEVVKYNPKVADGLRAGTVLVFPVDAMNPQAVQAAPTAGSREHGVTVVSHYVERGQTIYGLATHYGITTDELIRQNPIVANGLKAGQTLHLTIPAKGYASQGTPAAATPAASAAAPASTVQPVHSSAYATPAASTTSTGANTNSASASNAVSATVRTGAYNASSSSAATTQYRQLTNASVRKAGYVVKKKETFYSIAMAHGITVEELEAANPGVTVLREGQILHIPVHQKNHP